MKKAVVLGGGYDQIKLIQEFKERGYFVILVDYYDNPPGKAFADCHYKESTWDFSAVLRIARDEKVDCIGTISTDQPLVVAARVSEELNLNFPVTYKQSLQLTNKKEMKNIMIGNDIPTTKHYSIQGTKPYQEAGFKYPLVIKPADSSGSRGVSIIRDSSEFDDAFQIALDKSRTNTVIVEEFAEGILISVDAIVIDGRVEVLLIVDICNFSHKFALCRKMIYPSTISEEMKRKVTVQMNKIAQAFGLVNTPFYAQMIVNEKDLNVIELSARITGGSKPYFIPLVSGVDVVSAYVSQLVGENLKQCIPIENVRFASCNYIWSEACTIGEISGLEELAANKTIHSYGLYKPAGSTCSGMTDGSDRIGYFYILGESREEIKNKTLIADRGIKVLDSNGDDRMIHGIYAD